MILGLKIIVVDGDDEWFVSLRDKPEDKPAWAAMGRKSCTSAWESCAAAGNELWISDEEVPGWVKGVFTSQDYVDWTFPGRDRNTGLSHGTTYTTAKDCHGHLYNAVGNCGFKLKAKSPLWLAGPNNFHLAVSEGCSYKEYRDICTGKLKYEDWKANQAVKPVPDKPVDKG